MDIRAITYFVDIDGRNPEPALRRAGDFLRVATEAISATGIRVQSRRLATQPYATYGLPASALPDLARQIRTISGEVGINYVSLGPANASADPAYVNVIPDMFAAADSIFASVDIANPAQGIDFGLLQRTASVIQRCSALTSDGMANLYLCASANVAPGAPFFPAAYHGGGSDRFALAIESADLAVEAFRGAQNPAEARMRLTAAINAASAKLIPVARELERQFGISFGGMDFSLAPYPGQATSLGAAMEHLGIQVGGSGAVAAASLIMNAIEAAQFPRCGFSGLMLPVLEDTTLGERAGKGQLQINDLLLYSAICGTGLDCIPLPGDTEAISLAGILLDVAALALRLNKPLTARLMPLPGKSAGDAATFSFEYFVPSRVMTPPASPVTGSALASESGTLGIWPRPQAKEKQG